MTETGQDFPTGATDRGTSDSGGALPVARFLEQARTRSVLDVRTPAEFAAGHIPGAINLPLFSDDERAEIGTLYVQQSRQLAIKRGLDLIGPRMRRLVEEAETYAGRGELLVHCWRGGMRSGAVAWLLGFAGLRVSTLAGGYKAFRAHVLGQIFTRHRNFLVLGGHTGSGKTAVLHELVRRGRPVLDLEGLARHRGSAFGGLGQTQPTQEQFENDLSAALQNLDRDEREPIFVEDENRTIGRLSLPNSLLTAMHSAPLFLLEVPRSVRLPVLVREYGQFARAELTECVERIRQRLGGLAADQAVAALAGGDTALAAELVLNYYDRGYDYLLRKQERTVRARIVSDTTDPLHNAEKILHELQL